MAASRVVKTGIWRPEKLRIESYSALGRFSVNTQAARFR